MKKDNIMDKKDFASIRAEQLKLIPRTAMAYSARILYNHIECRRLSSVLYVISGSYEYIWADGRAELHPDELIYLPKGASYRYKVEPTDRFVCQLEFDTMVDGEECVFADSPVVYKGSPELSELMRSLTSGGCGEYRMMAGLYSLIGFLSESQRTAKKSRSYQRISPAVEYINSHYAEDIGSDGLAAMCYLSASQMRRIFVAELGVPPLEYRTQVRIRAAQKLLSGSFESIATVSAAVGYDSQFAFSKAFRRVTGLSPSEYALK